MFSSEPVDRLSRIVTLSPRAMRASARLEPMNPAPPVMKARMGLSLSFSFFVKCWLRFYAGGSQESRRRFGYEKSWGHI